MTGQTNANLFGYTEIEEGKNITIESYPEDNKVKISAGLSNDDVTTDKIANKAVTGAKIADGTIGKGKLSSSLQKEINDAANPKLEAGTNITITESGKTLTISNEIEAGSITSYMLSQEVKDELDSKQEAIVAGENITIENNVISLADDFIAEVDKKADKTYVDGELAKKQNNLTAGAGISINENNVISTSAQFQVEIVGLDEQGLPSVNEPSSQVLYLTHSTQTEVSDVYNEWLWIYDTEIESFRWEKIGSTQADLSGYAQKSELPTKTSDLTNDSNFVSDGNYVHTDNNFTTPEKQKLDTLENYVDTAVESCNTATEKATEIYNTVETKLNNGELKGEKGDKGDPGGQGSQGVKGDPGESGLIELKASTLERYIKNLSNHLYYTVDDVRLRTHNTQKIYLDLPQGTFLLVEKKTGSYDDIDLKITIWGSCTFNGVEYKYGIQQYKYNTIGGFIKNSFVLDTKSIETAIANLEANKQNNLTAGAGITITDNGVISSDVGLKIVVLKDGEDLPNVGTPPKNTIYFKRNTETDNESDDWYEEYIWVNNWWELIGTTKVDLSGYAQKSELPTKTSELQNDSGYITADDAPPEVYIGSEEPQGNEVIWVENNTIKVKIGNDWVKIPATTEIADDIISDKLTYSSKKIEELISELKTLFQPAFELGNGLQLVDGILSVSYPDGDNIKYGTEVINNE